MGEASTPEYSQGHQESVLRSHSSRTVENSASYIIPYLKPGIRILDVGCGPGTISVDFVKYIGPNGHVIAIDNCDDSVFEIGRDMARKAGCSDAIEFRHGNAFNLDFADGMFDIVHAHQVLQHVPDPVAVLKEMKRVAKPGTGIVAARDAIYDTFTWYPFYPAIDTWRRVYYSCARFSKGDPNGGCKLLSWALKAGYPRSAIKCSADVWCYADEEKRAWWGGLWADRMIKSQMHETALEQGYASEEELQEAAKALRAWAAAEDGWFSLTNGEIICQNK